MVPTADNRWLADLFHGLRGTILEAQLILGGSSGLLALETRTPALTEDFDFLVNEALVESRGSEIVRTLEGLGCSRRPETPTFTDSTGRSFDLVGYSKVDFSDHLSRPGTLQVMVFGDLAIVLGDPESTERGATGILSLSAAGFCAVKLMTVRVEKGAKDKLQALLLIAERASEERFRRSLIRILHRFDAERRLDALSDAQVAFLSLQRDPEFRDHGAEGYAVFLEEAEQGYLTLRDILQGAARG
jgi:hypothetical protein